MTMVCVETSCSQLFSSWLTGFFGRDGSSQLVAYVMYPTVDGMVWSSKTENIATTCALWVWIPGFQPSTECPICHDESWSMFFLHQELQCDDTEHISRLEVWRIWGLARILIYIPEDQHGTWEHTPGRGKSSEPSFSGSIFIFGDVEKDCKLRVQWFVTLLHLPQKPVWDERWRCTQSLFVGRKLV